MNIYPLSYLQAITIFQKKYFMLIGTEDDYREIYGSIPDEFELLEVHGDHFLSLKPAMEKFIKEIEKKQ